VGLKNEGNVTFLATRAGAEKVKNDSDNHHRSGGLG
jgi:hypothetical protein